MDDAAYLMTSIRRYVWSGFYDSNTIVEMIDEQVLEEALEIGHGWVRTQVEQAFARKRAEEHTWESVTDCDSLDAVFESLEHQGIIALQNAGYTQSDGLDDVAEVFGEAGGESSGFVAYCFYHGQDLERVMENGELHLAYGDLLGDDQKGVEIGRRIKQTLEVAGFAVEWDGSVQTRLKIKGFRWQRRGSND